MVFLYGFRQAFLLRPFVHEKHNFYDYENECRYECTFFRGEKSGEDEEYADCQSEGQHDLAYENDDSTGQTQDKVGPYE